MCHNLNPVVAMPMLYVSSGGRTQLVRTGRRGNVLYRVRNPIAGGFRMTARNRFRARVNRALSRSRYILGRVRRRLGGY